MIILQIEPPAVAELALCRSLPCRQSAAKNLFLKTHRSAAPLRAAPPKIRNFPTALEVELQCELQQPRIPHVQYLAKCSAQVRNIAVDGIELRMIPHVEDVRAEFHSESFSDGRLF